MRQDSVANSSRRKGSDPRALETTRPTSEHPVMRLQRTLGNQTLQRLLAQPDAEVQSLLGIQRHKTECGCSNCTGSYLTPTNSLSTMINREAIQPIQRHAKGCSCAGCGFDVQRKVSERLQLYRTEKVHAAINGTPIQRGILEMLGIKKKKPNVTQPTKDSNGVPYSNERLTFNSAKFALKDFIPGTGGGKFDTNYDPQTGEMVMTMRIHFNFKDGDVAYESTAVDPKELKWGKSQKSDWIKQWIDSVMGKWGNIPTITCDKPGFTDVVARPRFNLVPMEKPAGAHYALDISKAFEKKGGGMRAGGVSGVNDQNTGVFQEQDAYNKISDKDNKRKVAQHLSKTENNNNILPAYQRDRARLEKTLETLTPVGFQANSADFTVGDDILVDVMALTILQLRDLSALSDLHPINIQIGLATGESRGLAGTRFQKIKEILLARGVKNPLSAKAAPDTTASGRVIAGPDSPETKETYLSRWDRYTSAHEFGHMIGLLDEYCPAVSPELITKMISEGSMFDDEKTLSAFAKNKEGQNKNPQKQYANLLDRTGLKAQNWARPNAAKEEKSTSLMSGGFEVLTQHYVTIWDALAQMTTAHIPEGNWKLK